MNHHVYLVQISTMNGCRMPHWYNGNGQGCQGMGVPKIVVPQNGWFIMVPNPIKMDDLGVSHICGNTRIVNKLYIILSKKPRHRALEASWRCWHVSLGNPPKRPVAAVWLSPELQQKMKDFTRVGYGWMHDASWGFRK